METDRVSGLKFYSLGIVAKPKIRDDVWIEVDPIEEFSMDKGPIGNDTKSFKASMPNQHGVVKAAKLKGGSTIKAKWIPFGHSNRDTAPDVQPSETVMVFRFADTQDYYWTSIFREPTIRRLETVRYIYNNQPSGQAPATDTSSYWVEFSTHDKTVKLHTSSNDGEAAEYDITIDTKAGTLEIKDDLGNSLYLESAEGKLTATTENEVTIKTKRFVVEASESVVINTALMTVNGPLVTTQGVSMHGGSGMALEGNMAMKGNIAMEGDVHVTGNLTATNLSEG